MINGRPLRDGLTSGFNPDLYRSFPIELIDHIEIIRGPGSVLHGSNAFAGVVNIVLKKRKDYSLETKVTVGNYGDEQAEVYGFNSGDDYSLSVGAYSTRSRGDSFPWLDEVEGIKGSGLRQDFEMGHNAEGVMATGEYKNFKATLWYSDFVGDSGRGIPDLPSADVEVTRKYFNVEYHQPFADVWTGSVFYSQLGYHNEWWINEAVDNVGDSKERLLEATLKGAINENMNFVLGGNRLKDSGKQLRGLSPEISIFRSAVYTQLDYTFDRDIKLVGGVQWNKSDTTSWDASSRLAYIHQWNNNWTTKLLYGEAFRSPSGTELFINAPAFKGNPDLKPETMQTIDAQLIYQKFNYSVSTTLYHSKQKDVISRVSLSDESTQLIQENSGELTFKGIEIEGEYIIRPQLRLTVNVSHQKSENKNGVEDTTFAPASMVKVGFNYMHQQGITIGVFNSYFAGLPNTEKVQGAPGFNEETENYNMLTANISADIHKIFAITKLKGAKLSLFLDNLLDEDVRSANQLHRTPPDKSYTNNTIPNHWGRGAYLSAVIQF